MRQKAADNEREVVTYSHREEFANAVTHGFGFLVAIGALVYMVGAMPIERDPRDTISIVVYGVSLVLMFLSSTLYHAISHPTAKEWLKRFDHSAIYLLIAGTYTPLMVISVDSILADIVLTTVWIVAVVGVLFKIMFGARLERLSVASYLMMGWLGLIMVHQVYAALDPLAFKLLVFGGLAYSAGVIFFVNEKILYNHAIWHCFVIVGAFSHCAMMAGYVVSAAPT